MVEKYREIIFGATKISPLKQPWQNFKPCTGEPSLYSSSSSRHFDILCCRGTAILARGVPQWFREIAALLDDLQIFKRRRATECFRFQNVAKGESIVRVGDPLLATAVILTALSMT